MKTSRTCRICREAARGGGLALCRHSSGPAVDGERGYFCRPRLLLVPRRGLEPPRLAALVPETSASTNSATWAFATAFVSSARGDGRSRRYVESARRLVNRRVEAFKLGADPLYSADPIMYLAAHGAAEKAGNPRRSIRRLGFSRPSRGARAGQARLPRPGRGAPAGIGRVFAADGPGRPDPRRAGQS